MKACFRLPSGATCRLTRPGWPGLHRYHVLALVAGRGTTASEADLEALMVLGRRVGRLLGFHYYGNGECFALVYNGARTRRRPWPHVHLLPVGSIVERRGVLVRFFFKRTLREVAALLSWLRRTRGHVGALAAAEPNAN